MLESYDVTTLDHDRLVADLEALRRELEQPEAFYRAVEEFLRGIR